MNPAKDIINDLERALLRADTFDYLEDQPCSVEHQRLLLRVGTGYSACETIELEDILEITGTSKTRTAVSNMAMTIMGCGVMALPKVFASTGVVFGTVVMLIAYCLTIASADVLVKICNDHKLWSYADMVAHKFGRTGAFALQLSIIINNIGVLVVYGILAADLLVGSAPEWEGVIPSVLGDHTGEAWYLRRWFVISVFMVCIEGPLLALRDLGSLETASSLSVLSSFFFSGALTAVAGLAATRGMLAPSFGLWPDPKLAGKSVMEVGGTMVAMLPVTGLAMVCHFNILPIKASLADRSPGTMFKVVHQGAALVGAMYLVVATSGYAMFGRHTPGNVFQAFTARYTKHALGCSHAAAQVLVVAVKAAVLYMLSVTFVLKNWGLRECLAEATCGCEALRLSAGRYYAVTYASLAVVWALSVVVPDVFVVMLFVGSTACVFFSYLVPGALLARFYPDSRACRAGGAALLLVGMLFIVMGLQSAFSALK